MKYIIAVLVSVLALSGCAEELSESEKFAVKIEKSWDNLTDDVRKDICRGYEFSPEMILDVFMTMSEEDDSVEPYTEAVVENFLNESCTK